MKYLLLIYSAAEAAPQDPAAYGAMMAGYGAFNERLAADGIDWSGEPLQGVETATALRKRAGKVETMDGPFAETKEQLGGFYLIDVPDLDTALHYAAMIPTADYGTIEVRPVMDAAALLGA